MATVRLERRNSIVHMLLRATDIMQSMLTDIQYNLHPADLRIHAPMPQIRIESFWAFEEIVKLGEEAALKSLAAGGLVDRDRAEARLEQLESEHALEPGRAKNRS